MKSISKLRRLARIRRWYKKCRTTWKFPNRVGLHIYGSTFRTADGDHTDLLLLPFILLHWNYVIQGEQAERRYLSIRFGWIFWGIAVYFRLPKQRVRKPDWEY